MDERAQTVRIEDLEDNLMQAILGNGPLAGFAPLLKKLLSKRWDFQKETSGKWL